MNNKIEIDRERLSEIIELFEAGSHWRACQAATELRAILATPVAACLKSSADAGGMVTVEIPAVIHASGRIEISLNERGFIGETNTRHRPAERANGPTVVLLPERRGVPKPFYSGPVLENEGEIAEAEGWNACIDKTKELNHST